MDSYGISFKHFFTTSESCVFRELGQLMQLGIDITDGLTKALTKK